MPSLKAFQSAVFESKLYYDGLDEPVIVRVRPFDSLESQLAELDGIEENDAGKLKLYEIACSRLESWQNMRHELPASVDDLSAVPEFGQRLYKAADGRFFINGDAGVSPAEVDIPLTPAALLSVSFPFTLLFDIIKRAMEEADTKKKRGGKN